MLKFFPNSAAKNKKTRFWVFLFFFISCFCIFHRSILTFFFYNIKQHAGALNTDEANAAAGELIRKALDGEKIYKVSDIEKIEERENYFRNLEWIENTLGKDFNEVKELLKMINKLEKAGFNVINKNDIEFLENKIQEISALNSKTAKKDIERARQETISFLQNKDIKERDALVREIIKSQEKEDTLLAINDALAELEDVYENTNDGKIEKSKYDLPNTDYKLLKKRILQAAKENIENEGQSGLAGYRRAAHAAMGAIKHCRRIGNGK
ncbi:hypothetical protein Epro_0680 [Endomicrobium proavitum]|uniref:Uncharacterized protein n=1 Tax=Endomicrobium proavitum TaxID=1408281 RepID=A0A0G3WKQ3_9BACT|nr:hypothetical protein Epro_0680 [Endomicrobium proavitum]